MPPKSNKTSKAAATKKQSTTKGKVQKAAATKKQSATASKVQKPAAERIGTRSSARRQEQIQQALETTENVDDQAQNDDVVDSTGDVVMTDAPALPATTPAADVPAPAPPTATIPAAAPTTTTAPRHTHRFLCQAKIHQKNGTSIPCTSGGYTWGDLRKHYRKAHASATMPPLQDPDNAAWPRVLFVEWLNNRVAGFPVTQAALNSYADLVQTTPAAPAQAPPQVPPVSAPQPPRPTAPVSTPRPPKIPAVSAPRSAAPIPAPPIAPTAPAPTTIEQLKNANNWRDEAVFLAGENARLGAEYKRLSLQLEAARRSEEFSSVSLALAKNEVRAWEMLCKEVSLSRVAVPEDREELINVAFRKFPEEIKKMKEEEKEGWRTLFDRTWHTLRRQHQPLEEWDGEEKRVGEDAGGKAARYVQEKEKEEWETVGEVLGVAAPSGPQPGMKMPKIKDFVRPTSREAWACVVM